MSDTGTIDLCVPCAAEIRRSGNRLEKMREEPDMKITCWKCQRRRYGATYRIGDGKGKKK